MNNSLPEIRDVSGEIFKEVLSEEDINLSEAKEIALKHLWEINPDITGILKSSEHLQEAREKLYSLLEKYDRRLFDEDNELFVLERNVIRECIQVFKNIIAPKNEKHTGISSLKILFHLAKNNKEEFEKIAPGFILEFINLFKGISGNSGIYEREMIISEAFVRLEGREGAQKRTEILDDFSGIIWKYFKKYPSGLDEKILKERKENVNRIMKYYKATGEDWKDYRWHLKNVIKDGKTIADLIELDEESKEAIDRASRNKIPFGITPYYLSLMDQYLSRDYDHAIRAQVIPPLDYVNMMIENKSHRNLAFDFMGEQDTSPVDLITRRYPMICILKPYNTCSQICVYCQRNWEIDECMAPDAKAPGKSINAALEWLDDHTHVGEVLVTGGDPMVMKDQSIEYLLGELAKKAHIFRIRIGTRTPVVLPQRFTESLLDILGKFYEPGKREVCLVTHFIHPSEITPDSMDAIRKIKLRGISVYNQQVFTIENSRLFESAKLRHDLRLIGVDPYYNFNMKGKKEVSGYMAPIARILQERKEEARLLPGISRTDEPVFNVPRLGKNHLRAWQDHDVIMICPDGARIYQFHPWEKNIRPVLAYEYKDRPIYDYLKELMRRGEDLREYRNIWYYY